MTREEAVEAVKALCESIEPGSKTQGLSSKNVGGVSIGGDGLYFEFDPAKGELNVMALVYRFRAKPRPAVLEAFRLVEKGEDKGGGRFDFQAPSKSVLLTRTYTAAPATGKLKKDTEALMLAARRWRGEVVPKVAEQANAKKNRELR